jgi:hypothetical protein
MNRKPEDLVITFFLVISGLEIGKKNKLICIEAFPLFLIGEGGFFI